MPDAHLLLAHDIHHLRLVRALHVRQAGRDVLRPAPLALRLARRAIGGFCRRRGAEGGAFADDEGAQLLEDQQAEVLGDDLVRVAVADDEPVAVGDGGAGDGVARLGRDRGGGERAQVEEDHEVRGREELGQEVDEDGGGHVAGFVKEDAEAWGWS